MDARDRIIVGRQQLRDIERLLGIAEVPAQQCLHDLGTVARWEPDGDEPMRLVWRCKSCSVRVSG